MPAVRWGEWSPDCEVVRRALVGDVVAPSLLRGFVPLARRLVLLLGCLACFACFWGSGMVNSKVLLEQGSGSVGVCVTLDSLVGSAPGPTGFPHRSCWMCVGASGNFFWFALLLRPDCLLTVRRLGLGVGDSRLLSGRLASFARLAGLGSLVGVFRQFDFDFKSSTY